MSAEIYRDVWNSEGGLANKKTIVLKFLAYLFDNTKYLWKNTRAQNVKNSMSGLTTSA